MFKFHLLIASLALAVTAGAGVEEVTSNTKNIVQQVPEGAAAASPEQLRKNLKGNRGLQSGDGGDNGADTGAGGGATCFSGANQVEVQGKGIITMDSLEIGDYVRSGFGNDGDYSRVFSFAHLNRDLETDFVQIFSDAATAKSKPIELTHNHMLFVNNKAVRAGDVKVGDNLDNNAKVTDIKTVSRRGIYAPITESGELVVSGVRASSYVALLDHVVVDQHTMTHMFFAPQRLLCSINFSWCENETYSKEEGYSNWSGWATRMYAASNAFSAPVQHLLTLVCVAILPTWYALEQFFVAPLMSSLMLGYVFYKATSKKHHKIAATCY